MADRKPWTISWSMAGVWLVDCGREGGGYGRESGHLTFAAEDREVAHKVAAADRMLCALTAMLEETEGMVTLERRGLGLARYRALEAVQAATGKPFMPARRGAA